LADINSVARGEEPPRYSFASLFRLRESWWFNVWSTLFATTSQVDGSMSDLLPVCYITVEITLQTPTRRRASPSTTTWRYTSRISGKV
jgi:hypothetical protein